MLIVFGTLVLKTILPNGSHGDCNEFGHIHEFKIEKLFHKNVTEFAVYADDDGDSCHSAQTVLSIPGMPLHSFDWAHSRPSNIVKFNINIGLNFQSPDLDPPRKPPRLA